MPLPSLLLERLKRRKIIQEPEHSNQEAKIDDIPIPSDSGSSRDKSRPNVKASEDCEDEIIAEDYSSDIEDDSSDKDSIHNSPDQQTKQLDGDSQPEETNEQTQQADVDHTDIEHTTQFESVIGCPNKYNIYHDCSQYCRDNYSKPKSYEPSMEQRKNLALLLRTFPISNEWTPVYDPGVKTFYFWNVINNHVSWYPPGMHGIVSLSADQLRKSLKESQKAQP